MTIRELLKKLEMPQDCIDTMETALQTVHVRAEAEFSAALDFYMNGTADRPHAKVLLTALAEKARMDPRQSDMAVVLTGFTLLEEKYKSLGLPQALYENACRDIRCKLRENYDLSGIWGTGAGLWYLRFLQASRFALGRFQFETSELKMPGVEMAVFDLPNGIRREIHDGDTIVRIHIPATGEPITDELRMDAYRRAYDFYPDQRPDGIMVFSCKSWLLYDKHPEMLSENSNILKFMRDFAIMPSPYYDIYGDLWRIFGMPSDTPFEKLPEDTSLRRAYKKHLLAGGTPGECVGLFLFDGEKIYNKPTKIVKKPLE